jgi:hypothetical protein
MAGNARAQPGIATAAPHSGIDADQHEAAGHQHQRQHMRCNAVVGGLELVKNCRRERVEPDHRIEPVFRQEMQADQQRPATQ